MQPHQGQGQTYQYTLLSKNVLSPEDAELYELSTLAGLVIDPNVFKIIMDLLRMNVAPTAIDRLLKSLIPRQKKRSANAPEGVSAPSHADSSRGREVTGSRSSKSDRNK